MSKFKVDGTFNTTGTFSRKERGAPLPAEQEILPPERTEDWKPRSAEHISVPSPVMRRNFFGNYNHQRFQDELREVRETEKAATSLVEARTEKEAAIAESGCSPNGRGAHRAGSPRHL